MNKEVIFDIAKRSYQNAKVVIKSMDKGNEEFSSKFDILLQYSLLEIALADKDFDSDEVLFVKNIADSDIAAFLFGKTYEEISDPAVLKEVVTSAKGKAMELAEQFKAVAIGYEKATNDFAEFTAIERNVNDVFAAFMGIDGTFDYREMDVETILGKAIAEIVKA